MYLFLQALLFDERRGSKFRADCKKVKHLQRFSRNCSFYGAACILTSYNRKHSRACGSGLEVGITSVFSTQSHGQFSKKLEKSPKTIKNGQNSIFEAKFPASQYIYRRKFGIS